MAINFSYPTTGDNYSSTFVPNIINHQIALARMLDSVQSGSNSNIPTYAKRFNRTTGLLDEWGGTSWSELSVGYAKKSGDTFSGAVIFSSTVSVVGAVNTAALSAAGTISCKLTSAGYVNLETSDSTHTGYIGFYAANNIRQGYIGFSTSTGSIDTGTLNFSMNVANFTGSVIATSFSGSGAALTGTATGLSIGGNAATVAGFSVNSEPNTGINQIVRTDSNGYIQASWINTVSGDNGSTTITRIYASSDSYLRYYTMANFAAQVRSAASGSWGISITGSSGSTSQTSWASINTTTQLNAQGSQTTSINTATGGLGAIVVQGNGTNAAFMSFLRPSSYGAYFGIDTDNVWKVGGWSAGAVAYPILHSNNYSAYSAFSGAVSGTTASFSSTLTAASLNSTGNLAVATDIVAGGNVTAYSDSRVKTDVITITNAVNKVKALRGVYYVRTDGANLGKKGVGFIAQELRNIVPEVVNENENGLLSVAYGNINGLLAEALKEVIYRVERLETYK